MNSNIYYLFFLFWIKKELLELSIEKDTDQIYEKVKSLFHGNKLLERLRETLCLQNLCGRKFCQKKKKSTKKETNPFNPMLIVWNKTRFSERHFGI